MWFDEEDWLYQTCDECGFWWEITERARRRVTLCLYVAQPWFNHVRLRCPKCDHVWRIFGLKRGVYRRLLKAHAKRSGAKFAPNAVVANFERHFDIRSPVPRKLTPREERLVAEYRKQLEAE